MDYSPWGHIELDTTEHRHTHTHYTDAHLVDFKIKDTVFYNKKNNGLEQVDLDSSLIY